MQGTEQGRRFVVLLGSLLVSGSASEGEFAESWSDISMAGEITVNNSAVFQRYLGFAGLDHDMDKPSLDGDATLADRMSDSGAGRRTPACASEELQQYQHDC
jgi:hypothetical protein